MLGFSYTRQSVLHVTLAGEGIGDVRSKIENEVSRWTQVKTVEFRGAAVELRFKEGWFGQGWLWDLSRDWQVVEIIDRIVDLTE